MLFKRRRDHAAPLLLRLLCGHLRRLWKSGPVFRCKGISPPSQRQATFAFDFKLLKLEALIRPILHVRADANLNTMLKLFIAKRHHLALVKNTDGRVIGMVTLEDVVEEIVGDIEDEFDLSSTEIVQVGAQSWKAGGDVSMKLLTEKLSVTCSVMAASQTLAQWFSAKAGQTLCPGFAQSFGPIKLTIQRMRRGKVHQAKIELETPEL